jgi:DNA-binding MarR family transcriptional regulator
MKNYVKTQTSLSERDESVCVDVFRNIMRTRHQMHRKANTVAETSGLHAAELNVVDILGKHGPISMGRLSQETFISPSNTTSTVKKLELAGLVERTRSKNSDREVTVSLTAKGRALFRKCYPRILKEVYGHLSERLTRSEIASLARMLGKLSK